MQAQPVISWAGLLVIGVIVGLVLIFAFVLVLVLLNMAQQRRAWKHEERLKAQDRGETLPSGGSEWARACVCIAIGAGVPIAAFLFTALATLSQKVDSEIWWAPGVVGASAVYYGYNLAIRLFTGDDPEDEEEEEDEDEAEEAEKPAIDADAIDVVGRRGG
jgi:small-conductance mechanosensitive channel